MVKLIKIFLLLLAVMVIAVVVASRSVDLPVYEGPAGDLSRNRVAPTGALWDGERFRNLAERPSSSQTSFWRMRWTTEYETWPEWVETTPAPPPAKRLAPGEVRATFVNHATVLLQIGERNILTDPIWSDRTSPVSWAGPRRVHAPGIRFEDLPPIDDVIVSHAHYDHLDLPTLRRLSREHSATVWAGLGIGEWLVRQGVEDAHSLDWWQQVDLTDDHRLTFVPVQHWSNRGFTDRRKSLWGGYVVEHAGRQVYFGGDSAVGPHFELTHERFGAMDLALLPIGAYAPEWFMGKSHMNPPQAVEAHFQLASRKSIGIHFGCFQLTQEGRDDPAEWLERARAAAGLAPEAFVVPEVGETIELPSPNAPAAQTEDPSATPGPTESPDRAAAEG